MNQQLLILDLSGAFARFLLNMVDVNLYGIYNININLEALREDPRV